VKEEAAGCTVLLLHRYHSVGRLPQAPPTDSVVPRQPKSLQAYRLTDDGFDAVAVVGIAAHAVADAECRE
jgi:hypothetical protein